MALTAEFDAAQTSKQDTKELAKAPATIETTLNYIVDDGTKVFTITAGPGGQDVRSGGTPDPHRVVLHNGRPIANDLNLEKHGFRFVRHDTKVADFYDEFQRVLSTLRIDAKIWPMPVEIPNPIRFDQDTVHATYDATQALRFWRALSTADAILKEFRARFIGKASPVHFFWGSFDLTATRFSGRRAPERPGADSITKEAYSHEVSSVGWWPGNGGFDAPMFYSYAAPSPQGFSEAKVGPAQAYYDAKLGEFLLPYDAVRNAADPAAALLEFCQTTYEAAANLGKWDRAALEKQK